MRDLREEDIRIRDLSGKWSPVPQWATAVLNRTGFTVRSIAGLTQHLVSGDLDAYAARDGAIGTGTGALGLATGDRYSLRLARDRMLVIGAQPDLARGGWHEDGFAVTDMSAAYHIFEIDGDATDELLAEALLIDRRNPGPSAAVHFAATPAILYRHEVENRLRLHVERGLAASVWTWLELRR
jgi:sarcosine oxidase gamma subunit